MATKKKKTAKRNIETVCAKELAMFKLLSTFVSMSRSTVSIELAHFSSRAGTAKEHRLTPHEKRRGVARKTTYRTFPYITVDLVVTRHIGGSQTTEEMQGGSQSTTIRLVKPSARKKSIRRRLQKTG